MKVAIVGGGIGGCALALSLRAAGIGDIEVFEAARYRVVAGFDPAALNERPSFDVAVSD